MLFDQFFFCNFLHFTFSCVSKYKLKNHIFTTKAETFSYRQIRTISRPIYPWLHDYNNNQNKQKQKVNKNYLLICHNSVKTWLLVSPKKQRRANYTNRRECHACSGGPWRQLHSQKREEHSCCYRDRHYVVSHGENVIHSDSC